MHCSPRQRNPYQEPRIDDDAVVRSVVLASNTLFSQIIYQCAAWPPWVPLISFNPDCFSPVWAFVTLTLITDFIPILYSGAARTPLDVPIPLRGFLHFRRGAGRQHHSAYSQLGWYTDFWEALYIFGFNTGLSVPQQIGCTWLEI